MNRQPFASLLFTGSCSPPGIYLPFLLVHIRPTNWPRSLPRLKAISGEQVFDGPAGSNNLHYWATHNPIEKVHVSPTRYSREDLIKPSTMSNNHSESPTLTGDQSTPAPGENQTFGPAEEDQPAGGPAAPPDIAAAAPSSSAVSLTDLFPPVPRAPSGTPRQIVRPGHGTVFPPYIYINYEGFMRAADPFWEPRRPPPPPSAGRQERERVATSYMYTFTRSRRRRGRVTCSDRMAQWLDQLPNRPAPAAANNIHQHQSSQRRRLSGRSLLRHHRQRQQRPGAGSGSGAGAGASSASASGHNLHCHAQHTTTMNGDSTLPEETAGTSTAAVPAPQLPTGVVSASLQHPNPLRQHPVRPEDVRVIQQLRIPKRKSSLQYARAHAGSLLPDDGDSDHFPQQKTDNNNNDDDGDDEEEELLLLARGLQSIQLGHPVEFLGSERQSSTGTQIRHDVTMVDAPPPTSHQRPTHDANVLLHDHHLHQNNNSNNKNKRKSIGTQVSQLFGGDNHKEKRDRSEVRPSTPTRDFFIFFFHPAKTAPPPSLPPKKPAPLAALLITCLCTQQHRRPPCPRRPTSESGRAWPTPATGCPWSALLLPWARAAAGAAWGLLNNDATAVAPAPPPTTPSAIACRPAGTCSAPWSISPAPASTTASRFASSATAAVARPR